MMIRKILVFITHKVGLYNYAAGLETKLTAYRQRRRLKKYGLEALIQADKAFRSVGSFMFLDFGILLGAYREKSFIPYDSDLDAGVLHELMPQNLPELLQKYGFKHIKDSYVKKTGLLTEDVYSYKGLHFDFWIYFKKDNDLYCYLGRRHETKPPKQADKTDGFPCKLSWVTAAGFSEIDFLGHKFYAPNNIPQWLEEIYGSSFMSPVKQWSENNQPTRIEAHTERLYRRFYNTTGLYNPQNIYALIRKRGFACICKKIKRRFFIHDENVLSQVARLGAYDYLQKYKYALNQPLEISDAINPHTGKIWACWLQGVAHAPHIVQQCVHSITMHHPNNEVVLLDSTNIPQYVDIPDYITKKWRAGIIPNTHYSDIVRILLLAKYGGVWIDATTFLLDKIPEYIRNADLFAFKCSPAACIVAANWFIAAKSNHPLVLKVKNLLCEYWKKENKLASYSIFHLFFTMSVNSSDEAKALWKAVPYFDDVNCKILQNELFEPFNPIRLEQIKRLSVIQKLSYKFPQDFFDKQDTFYNRIIKSQQV